MKRVLRSIFSPLVVLAVSLVFLASHASAAGSSESSRSCEVHDSGGNFSELQAMIRDPSCNIKSIDDVIAHLPSEMRNRADLFYKSQSLQGPHQTDYLHPRAILRTKYGSQQLYITFNGKSTDAGYGELELLDVNQKTPSSVFKYYAIQFPGDKDAKGLSWTEAQAQIKVSPANSARCTACHGSPARPIYPTYPTWPGSFGSLSSNIDPIEKAQFARFVAAKNSDPESRYRHIMIPSANEQPGDFDLYGRLLFGHGHGDFDLSKSNSTRINYLAKQMPQYDQFKYAIVGALLDCRDYDGFFTPEINKSLRQRFKSDIGLEPRVDSAKIHASLKEFWKGGMMQFGHIGPFKFSNSPFPFSADPESIKLVPYTEFFKSVVVYWNNSGFQIDLFADTFKAQGHNHITPIASKLRYVMEGRGLNISNWFLDLKQPTYRMMVGIDGGEHFARSFVEDDASLFAIPDIMEVVNGHSSSLAETQRLNVCNVLKSKSGIALQGVVVTPVIKTQAATTNVYPQTFLNTCSICHVEQLIGPRIPFNDPVLFNHWLNVDGHTELIKYRLTGPPEQRMPLNRVLSTRERDELVSYIEQKKN